MRRRALLTGFGATAVAWPFGARAQQKAMPVIGLLSSGGRAQAFYQGLRDTGYDEGRNVAFEYHLSLWDRDPMSAMAAELVARKVDLIAAFGPPAAQAAKGATSTIPIVFVSGDPIAEGLVASLARPGGNLTGVSLITVELMPKRFEFLAELVPQTKVFALLVNPNTANVETMIRQTQEAAQLNGIQLHVLEADASYEEIDAAFATLVERRVGALIAGTDPLRIFQISYMPTLASRHAVPAMYVSNEFAWAGGLISYGASPADAYRQAGIYAGRILNGAKPADLPVVQPAKFELVINLKTAKALGLTVPQSILARADEVIE